MTIWYRQGTVSVENGSTAVNGTLTGWLNQVKAGDGITFDDGGSWHEVASVESNTALTLATEYPGEAVSGAAYAIDRRSPQWSLASDLAVKVAALLGRITTVLLTDGKPNDGIGNDGAIAFDPDAQLFYFKSGGAWDEGTSFKGDKGDKGDDGLSGWAPVLAVVLHGQRAVLAVTSWIGGSGEAPGTGYLSAEGITANIDEAIDVRGVAGQSFQPDAVVEVIAERDAYDNEARFCSVLVLKNGDGDVEPMLYFLLTPSESSPEWSEPVPFADGANADPGAAPILAVEEDNERRVLKVVGWTAGDTEEVPGVGGDYLAIDQNLADVADAAAARSNLGLEIGVDVPALGGGALVLPELEIPPETPSAGRKLLYAKDDGKVYTKDSAGDVAEVGAGGGGTEDNSAYQIVPSVGGNALTVAVKNAAGNDPDSGNPVTFDFRSATLTSGAVVTRTLSAALSLTLSSGSTLGAANALPFRLWIVLFDDGGTLRLGAIKCSLSNGFYALSEWALASSTAEGGAGGADSAGVFYTGTAVSSKPYKILGFMDWDSGLTTAGAWASGPSRVQVYERGMPLPGQEIGNSTRGIRTTQDNFTSTSYVDTNLTAGIKLRSPCNAVAGVAIGALAVGTVGAGATVAVRRGGAVVNLSQSFYGAVTNFNAVSVIPILDFPGATGPHTYTVAVKSESGPVYYPGATTTESGATISLSEVMG